MRFETFCAILIIGFATACNDENPVSDVNNSSPVIQAITFNPDTVIAGHSCMVECTAVDPDNDNLSYEWNTIGNISGREEGGARVYFTPNSCCGLPEIILTVKDGRGGSVDSQFTVPFKYDE